MPLDKESTDSISKDITDIKVTLARLEERIHGVPCNDLTQFMNVVKDEFNQIGDKFRLIFDKLELHNETYHSEKSTQNKWVAIAVIGCTAATILSPFISKWLG